MATLEDLEARVAALEATAAMPAYAPTGGQQVAPDGKVTYDFDGHVHARGLDLDAVAHPDLAAANSQVLWRRTAGANAGQMAAALQGVQDGTDVARLYVDVLDKFNAAEQRQILNSSGQSDFVQLGYTGHTTDWGPYSVAIPALAPGAGTPWIQVPGTNQPLFGITSWVPMVALNLANPTWMYRSNAGFMEVAFGNPFSGALPAGTLFALIRTFA